MKYSNKIFEDPKLCSDCGGVCCKNFPCCAFPEDFSLPDKNVLLSAINSGNWCTDWWEGDPRDDKDILAKAYFVRPAIKGFEYRIYHPGWGGECVFLTLEGCSLPIKERPLGGKSLEPKSGYPSACVDHTSKRDAAIAWIPFWDILDNLDR